MDPKNFKPTKLRAKTIEDLEADLNELRKELAALRVNQVSSGVAAKLAKIRVNDFFTFHNQKRISRF